MIDENDDENDDDEDDDDDDDDFVIDDEDDDDDDDDAYCRTISNTSISCSTCSVVRGSRRSPRHRRAAFWSVLQPSHLIIIIIITVDSPDRLPRVWTAAIIAAGQALGEVLRHAQVMSRLLLYLSSIYLSSIE